MVTSLPRKNMKDPTFYRSEEDNDRPVDVIDYREKNGPRLSYVWCKQPLSGQNLYLGAEIGIDGRMYCIPGHADRVMMIDPSTDEAILIGPSLPGKYKWLRGVVQGDCIFGLPCHGDTVLKIHVPSKQITMLQIKYDDFFDIDPKSAEEERNQPWKYHGGNVSPADGCIYAIPQSAQYVLKVDPTTDECTLTGPALPGQYKWYGGVVGQSDGAIYGIPHNSASVLRIHPHEGISLHGDFGPGGHKWHGAAAAANGVIVSVAANADTVLCITPGSPAPILTELYSGDNRIDGVEQKSVDNENRVLLQSGRHRSDGKYKFLGATAGPDGRVYCFPCAAERVLAVDTVNMRVEEVGPNVYDAKLERLCQNKWQNGVLVTNEDHSRIFGIPLAGESLLEINFTPWMKKCDAGRGEIEVTTWPIPAPYRCLGKWEGAVVALNGVAYSIPNNHKALLRIELPSVTEPPTRAMDENEPTSIITTPASGTSKCPLIDKRPAKREIIPDRPDYRHREDLVYKSGIPTLRASAHRVKFSLKNRKHDPKPKDSNGIETGTWWLPDPLCTEDVLSYDVDKYDLRGAVAALLQRCATDIVGTFKGTSSRLEDFVVPTQSTWRTVNGGQCESAQQYLSDTVISDSSFLHLFDQLVTEIVLPYLKNRLVRNGAITTGSNATFFYQRPPTLRLQPGPAWAQVKPHNDAEYGHQNGELNFWIPLTDRCLTGVDLWCETTHMAGDYHPVPAMIGDIIAFHGSSRRHYVNTNETCNTRASFDFRVGVQGFFDPSWEMQGTDNDHTRREFTL